MPSCDTCEDLQAEVEEVSAGKQTAAIGIQWTFGLEVPVQRWLESVETGCVSCRFIWNIICHFNKDLASERQQTKVQGSASPAIIVLEAWTGLPLLLALTDLPDGMYFPNLELYTTSKSLRSWTAIGHGEHVRSDLDLSSCVQLSRRWMAECLQNHKECKPKHRGRLPTRVLHLRSYHDRIDVHLYISTPDQTADYVALSYCWGTAPNLKTTSVTIDTFKVGIPWEKMPLSFRHAISLAVELGVEYIWIDSLCIIQDDKADWEREAGRMAQVYEGALLTIATDAAKDPMQGILVPRSRQPLRSSHKHDKTEHARSNETVRFPVHDPEGKDTDVCVRELHHHFDLISTSSTWDITYPLLSRAWTLQERLLASRTLHFTAHELVWECRKALLCECGTIHREFCGDDWRGPKIAYDRIMAQFLTQNTAATDDGDGRPVSKILSSTWTRIVHGYSSRRLKHPSDKLPAMSGVAASFAATTIDGSKRTYLAGLWKEDLSWLLCWRAFSIRYPDRQPTYIAPTWSWASVDSPVIWDTRLFDAASKVDVVDARISSAGLGHNQFGAVKAGHIILRGQVQPATVELDSPHSAVLALVNSRGERIYFVPDHNPPELTSPHSAGMRVTSASPIQRTAHLLKAGESVSCLLLLHNTAKGDVYGLVLASAGTETQSALPLLPRDQSAPLERIGIITEMSYQYVKNGVHASAWFAESKVETVTIV